ncbi:hypothetical protein BC936DRAFT_148842 [Jimgerdemannia flammicorona]|uniref:Uncharacterized protein n=1 Tax=Jimgerdemannia flammicorona TaxID=994334 RepID=A0A433DN85_9FUNG|nr:hypothetical protein BC936DRAFT_148842 [Jimgerdemannia flammicorona]
MSAAQPAPLAHYRWRGRTPRGNRRQAHQTGNGYVESESRNATVNENKAPSTSVRKNHPHVRRLRSSRMPGRQENRCPSSRSALQPPAEALTSGVKHVAFDS